MGFGLKVVGLGLRAWSLGSLGSRVLRLGLGV